MANDQPALCALFACESGLSEPEIGLEHTFVLLIWQKKHDKWVKCSNSFCHFHLILSVSWPQQPLIFIVNFLTTFLVQN